MRGEGHQYEVSPWRTPEAMANGRKARVAAMRTACRGPRVLSVDLKILFFLTPHVLVPLMLWNLDTWFRTSFIVGLWHGPMPMVHTVRAGAYIFLACVAVYTYANVYASDSGGIDQSTPGYQLPPCSTCGLVPTLRSRHCRATGQCVHKLDHYCWVLSTSIGDKNHRAFFCLLLVHAVMAWWAVLEVYSIATPCILRALFVPRPSFCFHISPPTFFLMCVMALAAPVVAAAMSYLLLLHTYLLCTNQTTVELIKGHSMPYLYPFYLAHKGPLGYPVRGPRDFSRLLLHELRGTGPPKPFSEGLPRNLWVFFVARKPYEYRYQQEPPSLTDIQQLLQQDEEGTEMV